MINKIEEVLINADPSIKIIYDNGFLIRCYTPNDECVINRIVRNDDVNTSELVKKHVDKLKKIGISPSYRIIHDSSYERFDYELMKQNFPVSERGVVFSLSIENKEKELFAFANFYENGIILDEDLTEDWLDGYSRIREYGRDNENIFRAVLEDYTEDRLYFTLVKDERVIAFSYATIIDRFFIINDIVVRKKYRDLDYGKKMLRAMLTKGLSSDCAVAIAEVREYQDIAIKMFNKEGFSREYSFQYRAK